ncbi:hypothetical protein LDENG_00103710 [Lucifuga dentata]|nr:hypothetical protein LDENG_00103710 [Lucifuga dentata]
MMAEGSRSQLWFPPCYVPHCVKGPLTCFLYFLALSLSFAVPLPLPYNRSFLVVYAKQTVLGRSSNWLVNGGGITAAEPHPRLARFFPLGCTFDFSCGGHI